MPAFGGMAEAGGTVCESFECEPLREASSGIVALTTQLEQSYGRNFEKWMPEVTLGVEA